MVLKLWYYLLVFIMECCHIDITLIYKFLFACFRLCKVKSSYYLIAQEGFKMSDVPSNNKISDAQEGFMILTIFFLYA